MAALRGHLFTLLSLLCLLYTRRGECQSNQERSGLSVVAFRKLLFCLACNLHRFFTCFAGGCRCGKLSRHWTDTENLWGKDILLTSLAH